MTKRVLSGIRATGRLHLGNYLGAVKGMLALQENPDYETFYMVADLHTLTTPYAVDQLQNQVKEVVLDYLSAGLDPEKSTIFVQSQVPQHTELAYLFSTVVSVARMRHLPTFKDRIRQYPEQVSMALLNYPILMAADILAYKAQAVPVGNDQLPHLEIAREVARKMNEKYGLDLPEPEKFTSQGANVPSLTGEGKMSKSVRGSFINLTDDLETIKQRLSGVPTDSGRGESLPKEGGVEVLLILVELFQGIDQRKKYEEAYLEEGIRYGQLKEELAGEIHKELEPIQKRRAVLENDPSYIDRILKDGAQKAHEVAKKTTDEVKQKMGIS